MELPRKVKFTDSHTGGEPTRVIFANDIHPDLLCLSDVMNVFESHPNFIQAIVGEPRGIEAMVVAILTGFGKENSHQSDRGILFFNRGGLLGMCGHGSIGVGETLRSIGQFETSALTFQTSAGPIEIEKLLNREFAIQNVASYREVANYAVKTKDFGTITGDIAFGGNWFFIANSSTVQVQSENKKQLLLLSNQILEVLSCSSLSPQNLVDHIELCGKPTIQGAKSKNFVLCPDGNYDRSPCGTGTSAKLACLAAEGKLSEGEEWIQESFIGSSFKASYRWNFTKDKIIPKIVGSAHIVSMGELVFEKDDPFAKGIN